MAHRIQKRVARVQPQSSQNPQPEQQQSTTTQPQTQKPSTKSNRPLLPSVDRIYTHSKTSYREGKLAFPPPQSLFLSHCNYDASPDFLRPTTSVIFGNVKKSSFPLGAWICPFGSDRVHKVRVNSPLRCIRCKAYVNGYFKMDLHKQSATCNICGVAFGYDTNALNSNNFNNTEISTEGVIDFVVTDKFFIKKRTDIVKILVVIQINSFLLESNAFTTFIDSAKASIQNTQFQKNVRIGIIIFNGEGVTYLKMNRQSQNWAQLPLRKYTVKYAVQGLCCPLSDKQMLFDPTTQKQKLLYHFDQVLKIADFQHKNSKYLTQGANYGIALKTIIQSFQQQVGRVILFSHTTPRSGPLAIRPRNQQDNKTPMKPLSQQYIELSDQLVKARIGVDMYIIAKQSLVSQQLATTQFIATKTGGTLHFYNSYVAESHGENLYYNVYGSFSRKYAYDVNFTARFSNGLNLSSFLCGDGSHESRDISLGTFDSINSVAVTFQQQQKIQQNQSAYMQFAIIFTNGEGERIIRVLNYRFEVSNKIENIHAGCDYSAVANVLLRQVANKINKGDMNKVREELINRLIVTIYQYVQENGNKIKMQQFLAHPNFTPALGIIHSYINSKIILNAFKYSADSRICETLKVNNLNFIGFVNSFYPKLFSLGMQIYEQQPIPGDLIEGEGDIQFSVTLPPSLPLTQESIKKDGVYLLWTSEYLMIIVQNDAPEDLLIQIFGTENWEQIQEMTALPETQNSHNVRINLMIEELRRRNTRANGIFLPLTVKTPKKKGPFQQLMSNVLKQDYADAKYFGFMEMIHRHVQLKIK